MTADGLARQVLTLPPRLGATRLVAIDGPSGSGKTTLAEQTARALAGAGTVVHMDDLYAGWDDLEGCWGRIEEWLLGPLRRGEPAAVRHYDWAAGRFDDEWHAVPVSPVLILEGCGSGRRAAAPDLSLLVWVEKPPEARWRHVMERDGEQVASRIRQWQRDEAAHFARERTAERAGLHWEVSDGGAVGRE